ncbi:hypothetical protein THAOC_12340 [Thalassiosira oceanica]|uniref:Uncharacterized protein n=1 Tax=Thalassiosira oceanica TaxID=159749 RepID=K0SN01_THAOC|nr:hypothetical protein THAOC_12340 [Thalassiosira oceanica]|eukprot:EJK66710.1 hypothetical protein THAOC_12340 [Thalassiosira oceanica]
MIAFSLSALTTTTGHARRGRRTLSRRRGPSASALLAEIKKQNRKNRWQGRRLPKEKPTWRIRDRLSAFQVTTTVANRCTATVQR